MRLKHIIIFLGAIIIGPMVMAQNSDDFYAGELSKMVSIPNSPEAEAFVKYGDHQVSLYSGVPSISLPIHTIKGREFDLPIGLTYDASGIKVEQIATDVGLGWNLAIGGRISRMINGLADDYLDSSRGYSTINTYDQGTYPVIDNINDAIAYDNGNGGFFPDSTTIRDYFTFLDDLISDRADAEQDYYSISAPGISGTIVLDLDDSLNPKVLDNPRIKVGNTVVDTGDALASISEWELTGEDGTKYYFEESERTHRQVDFSITNFSNIYSEYNSSWVLTKIVSKNGKDTYLFNYSTTGYWKQEQQAASAESTSTKFIANDSIYSYAMGTRGVTKYKIDQQILNTVIHNDDTVLTVNRGTRYDLKDANDVAMTSRVTDIDFLDLDGNTLKSIDFDNDDYFGATSLADPLDIRLKLNGFSIKGSDNNTYQTYAFEYEQPGNVPARDSYAQDYFGYYNGASNTTLIPTYDDGTYLFEGGDREPSTSDAKIGLLKKITYPTKGYTEFEFEGHDHYKTETVDNTQTAMPSNALPGGGVVHDAALYTNANNNYCLDHLDDPLIKFANFIVPEAGVYKVTYTGNAYAEAGIIYTGPSGGYNTYCTFFDATTVWNSVANGTYVFYENFSAGKHKAMMVLGETSSGVYGQSMSLKVDRVVQNQVSGNYDLGGLRIKEIRNYSDSNELATTKVYSYRDSLGQSTGRINYMPNLWSIKVQENSTSDDDYFMIRKAAYAKGNAPYVVYESVREIQEDGNGNDLGYVEHTFYDENKGVTPRSTTPFENNYFPSLKGGEPQQKMVVAANGDLQSKQDVEYYETSVEAGFLNKGWVAHATDEPVQQVLYIRGYNVGQIDQFYSYEYKDRWTGCANGGSYSPLTGTSWCSTPAYVSNPSSLCTGIPNCTIFEMDDKYAAIRGRFTTAATVYGGVSSVKDTVYQKDASNTVVKVANSQLTEYDSTVDYLPRRSTNTDSKGDVWQTTHYYPKDSLVTGYADLITRNNLVAPMKTVTVKNPDTSNEKISGQEVEYLYISTASVQPKKIKTSKGSQALRDLGEFTYYTNGNLKTSKRTDGPETIYIWGYDDRYPVAKVENAAYTAVTATGISSAVYNNSATTDSAMQTELDKIRTHVTMAGAMVTTYTYDPLVGVTSITDPSGNTITYVYDDFNRLKEVRDADNNLVSDQQYHYRGQ